MYKRQPLISVIILFEQAGVNDDGVIQYLMASVYEDDGVAQNDPVVPILVIPAFPQIYDSSTWTVNAYDVRTDKATTCWMRGPGKFYISLINF